jgi:hypothetical protein
MSCMSCDKRKGHWGKLLRENSRLELSPAVTSNDGRKRNEVNMRPKERRGDACRPHTRIRTGKLQVTHKVANA